jgi:hypothetical protein
MAVRAGLVAQRDVHLLLGSIVPRRHEEHVGVRRHVHRPASDFRRYALVTPASAAAEHHPTSSSLSIKNNNNREGRRCAQKQLGGGLSRPPLGD